MRGLKAFVFAMALLSVWLAIPGCGHQQGQGSGGMAARVVDCGSAAVVGCAAQALPAVTACLQAKADGQWAPCLAQLVGPGICMSEAAIACMVRHQGSEASAGAQVDRDNGTAATVAARAREWIARQGYVFKEPAGSGGR